MQRNDKNIIRRFPPCPAYHLEAMETWLESMAAEGYFLSRNGFFMGRATFEAGSPRRVRYRLQPVPKRGFLDSLGYEPGPEELELSEALGWNYVARRGRFQIYMASDPAVRELNTDPEVQALALAGLKKEEQGNFFNLLWWTIFYPLFRLRFGILATALAIGSPLFFAGFILIGASIAGSLNKLIYLHRLKSSLARGEEARTSHNWRPDSRAYIIKKALLTIGTLVWAAGFIYVWQANDARKISLADYRAELPFATLENLGPEGAYTAYNILDSGNAIAVKDDYLAGEVIELWQTGSLQGADGKTISGGLRVEYYHAKWVWLAKRLAHELRVIDRWSWPGSRDYQALDLPPGLGVDYAVAYTSLFPTVILQEDNKMIRIMFYQSGPEELAMEKWLPIFTAYFLDGQQGSASD